MSEQSDGAIVPEVVTPAALVQITKGEVDMQVATAKRFPRDVTAFQRKVRTLALLDEEVAASLEYAVPRAGKVIRGPSIRLAEIVASSWGNLRAETRILDADKTHVTSQAMVWDMETNTAIRSEVKRRITTKGGKRYGDDMITTTGGAGASVALRNAVFRVVPLALVKGIIEEAKQMGRGDVESLAEKRGKIVDYFARFGVPVKRVCATLGKPGLADLDWDDIDTLRAMATAIKEGTTNIDEAFPAPVDLNAKGKQSFADAMTPKTEKPQPEAAPEEEPKKEEPKTEPDPDADEREAIKGEQQETLGDDDVLREAFGG